MIRFVQTQRWRDLFWNELHPYPKILLCYIYDNADSAGFIDYSASLWLTQLKGKSDNKYSEFTKKDLLNSLADLKDKLVSNGKNKLFIKDFLKHQKKLPLIRGNEESDSIIEKLKSNLFKFNNAKEIQDILDSVKEPEIIEESVVTNQKRNTAKKFVAPSYEVFKEYYLTQRPNEINEDIQGLYDHYVSCGWKVGNKKMADYEAAIRASIRRNEKFNKNNNNTNYKSEKSSRTEVAFKVSEELKQTHGTETRKPNS